MNNLIRKKGQGKKVRERRLTPAGKPGVQGLRKMQSWETPCDKEFQRARERLKVPGPVLALEALGLSQQHLVLQHDPLWLLPFAHCLQ